MKWIETKNIYAQAGLLRSRHSVSDIYIYITASKKDTMYGDIWLGTSGCGQDTFGGQSL
jgi:hypothetical protein